MIFGELGGLKFPDICLTGEEKPRKNPHPRNLSRPGIEPGPAAWQARMLPVAPQRWPTQNSVVKISSSSPKLLKSPRVKISRKEDSPVAQFATYRPIWQPWIQATSETVIFPNISWPRLPYLTQNVGELSAVHKVSCHFWRHTSFSPKLLKIGPIFTWTFFISMTWQINSLNE